MRRLVIDCATEACSVALFESGSLLAGEHALLGRGHAERLVPMIANLPGKGRAGTIAVDVGPGSFTGIRVGLAAARALALAWGARLEGYDSLTLVAAMALAERPGQPIDVCMTGGHGEWFFQCFSEQGTPLAPVVSLKPEVAIAQSSAAVVAGSQSVALAAARHGVEALEIRPDAREHHLLAKDAMRDNPQPSYGRAPDARLPSPA
jgi:tRNA threonylcarbamoyladenosine biosynthesis protein TsaB